MSKIIIAANPQEKRKPEDNSNIIINIAEFFSQTIQGEGASVGSPSAFLRLKDCTLNCIWCDTTEVWRRGNPYTVWEVLELMEQSGLVEELRNGHHLILTGGSPLKQQSQLAVLFALFQVQFNFLPFIEVENECMLQPIPQFSQFVAQWNNSPKLENSKMKKALRLKPEVIRHNASLPNSWFKFVIADEKDWQEVEEDFLKPQLIQHSQIILMPCGSTQEELNKNRDVVAELAVKYNVLFSDRLHITLWNKKVSV